MNPPSTAPFRLRFAAIALACVAAGSAFADGAPDPARTRAYIDKAWTTLTRSQTECAALTDSKVVGHPVLYVPIDESIPPSVA
ncbi:MAG TPA: trehalase, partial [Dyella sp.]